MDQHISLGRRQLTKRILAASIIGCTWSWSVLAAWPKKLFSITQATTAEQELTNGKSVKNEGVELTVPGIAENGAQVRVEVKTRLADVKKIFVLAEKNPIPLIAQFNQTPASLPEVAINVKINGTSNIIALVETQQGIYRASQETTVTAGGCG